MLITLVPSYVFVYDPHIIVCLYILVCYSYKTMMQG